MNRKKLITRTLILWVAGAGILSGLSYIILSLMGPWGFFYVIPIFFISIDIVMLINLRFLEAHLNFRFGNRKLAGIPTIFTIIAIFSPGVITLHRGKIALLLLAISVLGYFVFMLIIILLPKSKKTENQFDNKPQKLST